jgi:hypothetical protein
MSKKVKNASELIDSVKNLQEKDALKKEEDNNRRYVHVNTCHCPMGLWRGESATLEEKSTLTNTYIIICINCRP